MEGYNFMNVACNGATPDTSSSVWKVANKLNELELHVFSPDRKENDSIKAYRGCAYRG
jgi:hypothetical protein